MSKIDVLASLAQHSQNSNVHLALSELGIVNVNACLASNHRLDKTIWQKIYKDASIETAIKLAFHTLDSGQILQLLEDKRVSVRTAPFHEGLPKCDLETAKMILTHPNFTKAMAQRCWDTFEGPDGIQEELFKHTLTLHCNTAMSAKTNRDYKSFKRSDKVVAGIYARFWQKQSSPLTKQELKAYPRDFENETLEQLSNGFRSNIVVATYYLDDLLSDLNPEQLRIALRLLPGWALKISELRQTVKNVM